MRLLPLLTYGIPIITIVQSLTNCPKNAKENLLLSRETRSIISADWASTYAAFLAPESLSVSLAISLSIMIFQVLGYGLWGAVYQLYQEAHKDTKASDVAKALFEQLLSPQGVQNRITLWSRELWSARLFHSIVTSLAAPEATIAEYSNKGLKIYTETVIDEHFALGRMKEVAMDGFNMFTGWAIYWAIARYYGRDDTDFFQESFGADFE